jgi:ATP-dependent DNA helicase DinG
MPSSAELLGAQGPFAALLDGFVPRTCQQELSERVERAISHKEIFIAESGTGTGKTFAYLVPALLSGRRVLISTGTKNLQDQLYNRDLPLVRRAVGAAVTAALLKGRANYLCLYRLELAELEGRFRSREQPAELARIRSWAGMTRSGDIAEVSGVPEQSDVWPLVTSTVDNCLGVKCPRYDDCFVNRARREALSADVLVVNHHLFFADLVLREDGFGQLLPGADAVIFDEAHQLPEVASNFFGISVGGQQLIALARDCVTEELREGSAVADLMPAAERLEKLVADLRLSFGADPRRAAWSAVAGQSAVAASLEALVEGLTRVSALLELAAPAGDGLASCWRRAADLSERLAVFSERPPPDYVQWFETTARSFILKLTPMDTGAPFREHVGGADKAWVFTSATLTINRSFSHFQSLLGLEEAETGLWDSPFDFARQALLYVPQAMPRPMDPEYTRRVVERALPVLQASGGRAFLLFTSHRALREAADLLAARTDFPLLIQGQAPRSRLLTRFRETDGAVLLGTASFWEGVDVRGEALSCVIIDKLPFAAPTDPVLQARAAAMEEAGRNPFMEYQLPSAVITLKQGVGRLIRDVSDRGVLMICDPRLLSRGYGKVFLNSLPPMPLVRDVAAVEEFFSVVASE